MNYVFGASLFLIGAIIAYFHAGNSTAAWIVTGALVVGWGVLAVYVAGVRHGKRNNDL